MLLLSLMKPARSTADLLESSGRYSGNLIEAVGGEALLCASGLFPKRRPAGRSRKIPHEPKA